MDTLSLLLNDIHLSGARFLQTELKAPWHIALSTPGLASFHVVSQGSGLLILDDSDPIELRSGEIVILPAGQAHRVCDGSDPSIPAYDLLADVDNDERRTLQLGDTGEPTEIICGYFQFDAELAKPLMAALPPVIHIRSGDSEGPSWMRIGLMFLANELSQERPAQQAIFNRMVDILLIECLRGYVDHLPASSGNWLLALRDSALSTALAAIHSEPSRPWTVPMLAEIACQSRSTFAANFVAVMGEPPMSYITRHRLRIAAWQLRFTHQPICHIAEHVGYASDAAFSQSFKRHYQCSPSHYRNQYIEKAAKSL